MTRFQLDQAKELREQEARSEARELHDLKMAKEGWELGSDIVKGVATMASGVKKKIKKPTK